MQTLATIGYGAMAPATRYGHVVVVFEALVGTLGVALVTGVTFAKFARPTARVLFASKAVVHMRDGVPHLVLRLANWRGNMVVEGQLRVHLLMMEKTSEGDTIRVPRELPLVRDRTAMFALTWMPMHRIDDSSPLHGGASALEALKTQRAEMYLSFSGVDETMWQPIHAPSRLQAGRHRLQRTLRRRAHHRRRRPADHRLRALPRRRAHRAAGRARLAMSARSLAVDDPHLLLARGEAALAADGETHCTSRGAARRFRSGCRRPAAGNACPCGA